MSHCGGGVGLAVGIGGDSLVVEGGIAQQAGIAAGNDPAQGQGQQNQHDGQAAVGAHRSMTGHGPQDLIDLFEYAPAVAMHHQV